jgi:hypothetical protein
MDGDISLECNDIDSGAGRHWPRAACKEKVHTWPRSYGYGQGGRQADYSEFGNTIKARSGTVAAVRNWYSTKGKE